jgi:hypothetical protein
MTLTAEQKTVKTVEVELPAYYTWGSFYVKILDENTAIRVKDYDSDYGISYEDHMKPTLVNFISEGERITEENFLDVFHRVGEKVKRELIKAIETDGWKAQEQAELQAGALAEVETTQS